MIEDGTGRARIQLDEHSEIGCAWDSPEPRRGDLLAHRAIEVGRAVTVVGFASLEPEPRASAGYRELGQRMVLSGHSKVRLTVADDLDAKG